MTSGGCSIYSSSVISPCKNAVLTSRCLTCTFLQVATLYCVPIVVSLTTGAKVSLESSPYFCKNPFATSHRSSTFPFTSCFSLNTHLYLMAFMPGGSLLIGCVSVLCSASVSSVFFCLVASSASLCSVSSLSGSLTCDNLMRQGR